MSWHDKLRQLLGLKFNLFWRTYALIFVLIFTTLVAWYQLYRVANLNNHTKQTAEQFASLIHLSRTVLIYTDDNTRSDIIQLLYQHDGIQTLIHRPTDVTQPLTNDALALQISDELTKRLPAGTKFASSVNGLPGIWVSFQIWGQDYWLGVNRSRYDNTSWYGLLVWLLAATFLTGTGAAFITRMINDPYRRLSLVANKLQDHHNNNDELELDEGASTAEIRDVNIGFNRMSRDIKKAEQARALMMAGISHDLRTPLSRLRLEIEMSVPDQNAQNHMINDIEQLNTIIDKFLDYAKSETSKLVPVSITEIINSCIYAVNGYSNLRVRVLQGQEWKVMADPVELTRVITNLIENARHYGQTPSTGKTVVDISAKLLGRWVTIIVRDHGTGVAPDVLPNLTKPFFRANTARTTSHGSGSGLGLSIAEKTVFRMGGVFTLYNANPSGLGAKIKLRLADEESIHAESIKQPLLTH